ncbi:MAG: hypothetical protein HY308_17270 [Gammaproteobacteria bacterium]|nr:hypothetical protein [Gammaproteobacteria bacterium]
MNCGSDCSESYANNTAVTLTAAPASADFVFDGWGGDCSGTNLTCTVTMSAAHNAGNEARHAVTVAMPVAHLP